MENFIFLDEEFRRAQLGQDRADGNLVSNTVDNQDVPASSTSDAAADVHTDGADTITWVRRGATGPAKRGYPNDFSWQPQDRLEILTYAETMAIATPTAGGDLRLDPNVASVWQVNTTANINFLIGLIEDHNDITIYPSSGDPNRPIPQRVYSFVIFLNRQVAGIAITWPAGTKWSSEVTNPTGDATPSPTNSLLAPNQAPSLDIFVLTVVPGIGVIGQLAGIGYA